jgi:hypothetical protein
MAEDAQVITKRKVTMKSITALPDGSTAEIACEDYVRPDFLDAYVADARTKWQSVTVSDEPDAGPLGYDGPTYVPEHLPVPNAGEFYPATPGSEAEAQLAESEAAAAENQEG